MPMATAVWLVENTTLTFKQIADFCKLHEVEVQGIADGEVAKGIKAYNPIISGQLSREEINLSSEDESGPLQIKSSDIEISNSEISLRENIGLLAYSPLAGGRLSGKYLNNSKPKNARYTLWPGRFSRHLTARGDFAVKKYFKLAKEFNLTMVQLAQSFVNSRPFVTSNIIGATTMDQLKENVESINIEFTNEMMERVNEIHNNNPNPSP